MSRRSAATGSALRTLLCLVAIGCLLVGTIGCSMDHTVVFHHEPESEPENSDPPPQDVTPVDTMPDLIGMTMTEVVELLQGHDGMVRFASEDTTYVIPAQSLGGATLAARTRVVGGTVSNKPLSASATDHFVVWYQRPDPGTSLTASSTIFMHAEPSPSGKGPWLGVGHAHYVLKHGARECSKCHGDYICSSCHRGL